MLHASCYAPAARSASRLQPRRALCRSSRQAPGEAARSGVAGVLNVAAACLLLASTSPALAIPQTSACATNSCDDGNYSNRDLRAEFYTKGSLKRANFAGSNLEGVTLFGADLTEANFTGANLKNANLGQANLTRANLTDADCEGAIMSSARLDGAKITNADFSGVIIRKDLLEKVCVGASGTNPSTGVDTRESLMCP